MGETSKPAAEPDKKSGGSPGSSDKKLPDPGKESTRSEDQTGTGSKGGERKSDGGN